MAEVRESIAHLYSLGRFQDVQVEADRRHRRRRRAAFNLIRAAQRRADRVPRAARAVRGAPAIDHRGALRRVAAGRPRSTRQRSAASSSTRTTATCAPAFRVPREIAAPAGADRPDVRHRSGAAGDASARSRSPATRASRATRSCAASRRRSAPPYQRARLQTRLDEYVRRLKERAIYEAVGVAARDRVRPTAHASSTSASTIDAGPLVTVRFEGDPLPRDRRDELAPLEREGSVDEDLLEDSEAAIRAYLRQQGYWKADVTVARERTDTALTIVFTIKRGRQYRSPVGRGRAAPRRSVVAELMPLIPLEPGELFVESHLGDRRRRGPGLLPRARLSRRPTSSSRSTSWTRRRQARAWSGRPSPSSKARARPSARSRSPATPPFPPASCGRSWRWPPASPTSSRDRRGPRRGPARVPQPRLCAPSWSQPAPKPNADATRIDLVFEIQRRPADDRRSHPHRRQRAHRRRGSSGASCCSGRERRSGSRICSRAGAG